jgi:hypothetical protein
VVQLGPPHEIADQLISEQEHPLRRESFHTLPPLSVKLIDPVSARMALHATAASGTDPRLHLAFVMEPT